MNLKHENLLHIHQNRREVCQSCHSVSQEQRDSI